MHTHTYALAWVSALSLCAICGLVERISEGPRTGDWEAESRLGRAAAKKGGPIARMETLKTVPVKLPPRARQAVETRERH